MLRISIVASLIFFAGLPPAFAQSANLSKLQGDASEKKAENAPPIVFTAELSSYEESAVTDSPGIGHLECSLEPSTLKFSWKLTYTGLTSAVTNAAFHGPQIPGGEAGVLINLGPHGLKSPIEGSVILDEGQLEYLLIGRIYVNIKTVKFPVGEIRGQLARQRPKRPIS